MTAAVYQKLTIPQLKALCKEKKISGYSKLSKSALVEKLLLFGPQVASSNIQATQVGTGHSTASNTTSQPPYIAPTPNSQPHREPASISGHPGGSSVETSREVQSHETVKETPQHQAKSASSTETLSSQRLPDTNTGTSTLKRPLIATKGGPGLGAKKSRISPPNVFKVPELPARFQDQASATQPISVLPGPKLPCGPHAPIEGLLAGRKQHSRHKDYSGPSRFLPPTSRPRNTLNRTGLLATRQRSVNVLIGSMLWSLDFPDTTKELQLNPVSLPPSMSQRKKVALLALCLSEIDQETFKTCTQVSRLFRYAVYISAAWRLRRRAPGKRLSTILREYPESMTDLWPYFRTRQQETQARKQIFLLSWLSRALGERSNQLVADRLWWSPDNSKQLTIALRFLLTRTYNMISYQSSVREERWLLGSVMDVQETANEGIWAISFQYATGDVELIHVLEQTCEVIGPPMSPQLGTHQQAGGVLLREDWMNFATTKSTSRLLERVCWSNHEEYERGISRHWLVQVQSEGVIGRYKLRVAERYVLACVFANSISGRWMSSTEMSQEFSGLPARQGSSSSKTPHAVNLFLPAHHHVEGVYFHGRGGRPLHSAVATVQTPSREYFILRDNGMQVGCEEEGIPDIWATTLDCDSAGFLG